MVFAIMWQNQHFLRALRVFNFGLVPNPEPVNAYDFLCLFNPGLSHVLGTLLLDGPHNNEMPGRDSPIAAPSNFPGR